MTKAYCECHRGIVKYTQPYGLCNITGQGTHFRKINKPIMLGHITEIGEYKGNPRRLPLQTEALIRQHRVKNKRYRPMFDLETASRDNLTLVCYSYSLIPRLSPLY